MNVNERSSEQWEQQVSALAHAFTYPPTPDVAAAVRRRLAGEPRRRARGRRLAWAAAGLALLLLGLLAVPQVRAGVIEFLRVGVVRIFLREPPPTATPAAVPAPTPTPLASLLDLAGETTLADARTRSGLAVPLPEYPPDLGPPDRVYAQELAGPTVILVWLDTSRPDGVKLSLHVLGPGTAVDKVQPLVVQETTVNGRPALWAKGPYMLQLKNGDYGLRRLVTGNTLIWEDGETTYRLETDLSLEEAERIAESLR